jgi:hypothetical protein
MLEESRFCGHLPKTLIDLNRSMSALPCWHQLRIATELPAIWERHLNAKVELWITSSMLAPSTDGIAAATRVKWRVHRTVAGQNYAVIRAGPGERL